MGKWLYLTIISIASFLTPFLGASMNVVIPVIGVEFRVNPVILSWFSISTLLSSALMFLPLGVYGDRMGRVKIFKYGLLIFSIATLLTGLAFNEIIFLVLRFIQGVGAAAISVTGTALISDIFPPDTRGFALGINISSIYVGLTLGPFIGGSITSLIGWRYVFLLIFLLSLTALYITYRYLDIREEETVGGFDYIGSAILGIAFTALILGLSLYPSNTSIISLLIFPSAALAFIIWEYRCNTPLLDFRYIFNNRLLILSVLTALMAYTATFASSFLLSILLQYILGIEAFLTGLILMTRPTLMALLSALTGKLSDIIQPKYIVSIGLSLDFIAYILLSMLRINTGIPYIILALGLLGIGSALFSSPNTNAILSSVDKRFYGMASGLTGTARVYGQSFSMSIVSLLFSIYLGSVEVQKIPPIQLLTIIDKIFIIFGLIVSLAIIPSILRGDLKR